LQLPPTTLYLFLYDAYVRLLLPLKHPLTLEKFGIPRSREKEVHGFFQFLCRDMFGIAGTYAEPASIYIKKLKRCERDRHS